MTDRRIDAELLDDGVTVRLSRGTAVSDDLWLQIRAEWPSAGRQVERQLVVPLERFLTRRAAFGRLVTRASTPVALNDGLKALVQKANADQGWLRAALDGLEPLDETSLAARLDGTRYKRPLREFQQRDLGHLLALSHGANFSVPGAGKTAVTLAAYEAERAAGRVERLLVIAPISAFGSWEDEAGVCFTEPPVIHRFDGGAIPSAAEIVLVNYHRLAGNYEVLAEWVATAPSMVVLDEAHRMKRGWDGQWGSACLNLAQLAQRRDILTGTPAPQSPKDFIALVDYLWPGQAMKVLPEDAMVSQPSPAAAERVANQIGPLFVRTNKRELDLPETTKHPIVLPLQPLHREIYMALRDQYAGIFKVDRSTQRDFRAMGRIVMYLLEAATNPKLLTAGSLENGDPEIFRHPPLDIPDGSELADLLARYHQHETPAKFIELKKLLKANSDDGRKTLVWSNFVRNLKLLQRELAALEPAVVHGAIAPEDREAEIKRFRTDDPCRVLLANPAAMSEGISLHRECHDAIYLERTFNAGQYLQSVDRIHRLGLEPDTETNITFLISDETIDVTVDGRVRDKAERLGEMLGDPSLASVALPNEDDYGPPVEDDLDIAALFKHLRGDHE